MLAMMTQLTDTSAKADLLTEIRRVLESSDEPLTLSKIRSRLPAPFRATGLEELAEVLKRQVAASVLWQYPKYRSPQDRFWDRPMDVHVAVLLLSTLAEGPLPWSVLRRKLPAYTQSHALGALENEIGQGRLHRHPKIGRGGERFGVRPADPKDYLRAELIDLFRRLDGRGFSRAQLREAALELLHDEEWSTTTPRDDQPQQHPSAPQPAAPPATVPEN
jgi:hypothetical protein